MQQLRVISTVFFTFLFLTAGAQDYRLENNEIKVAGEITFKTGTAELLPESKEVLYIIKRYLDEKKYISLLRVEAHAGNPGNAEASQQLTEKRAAELCQQLVGLGVACSRLLPVGFGGTKPVADNSGAGGRSQNTRVNFVIASLNGKAIGGMPLDGGGKIAENPCY